MAIAMSFSIGRAEILGLSGDGNYAAASSETINTDPHFSPNEAQYLTFPMIKSDYGRFSTHGTSTLLKNKAVIVPELKNVDGFLYTKGNNYSKDHWIAHVDLSIGNKI
jgi:hypothetical protein